MCIWGNAKNGTVRTHMQAHNEMDSSYVFRCNKCCRCINALVNAIFFVQVEIEIHGHHFCFCFGLFFLIPFNIAQQCIDNIRSNYVEKKRPIDEMFFLCVIYMKANGPLHWNNRNFWPKNYRFNSLIADFKFYKFSVLKILKRWWL